MLLFVFQLCNKTTSSMKHLQIHQQREHKDEMRHFCTTCKEGFFEKDDMIRHRYATLPTHLLLKTGSCFIMHVFAA